MSGALGRRLAPRLGWSLWDSDGKGWEEGVGVPACDRVDASVRLPETAPVHHAGEGLLRWEEVVVEAAAAGHDHVV